MAHFTETVKNKVIWREYPSLVDAYAQARLEPTNSHNRSLWKEYQSREKHENGKNWYGVNTLTEVKKALAEGWEEGTTKLKKISDDVTALNPPKPISTRRRRSWADAGDTLDITRTYAGDLNAWQRCTRAQANTTRYFDLIINLGIPYHIKAETLLYRGASALVLSDLLVRAGYSVKIKAGYACRGLISGTSELCADMVTVKDYQDPLDINSLASIVCLAGFFRYVLFSLATQREQTVCGSLGSTVRINDVMEQAGNTPPASITDFDKVGSLQSAMDFVREKVQALQGNDLKMVA